MGVRSVAELVPLGARIGVTIGLDLHIGSSVGTSQKTTYAMPNQAFNPNAGRQWELSGA
jgi:hypothetical protein